MAIYILFLSLCIFALVFVLYLLFLCILRPTVSENNFELCVFYAYVEFKNKTLNLEDTM